MKDPHLITVDELRAAGALDVPAAWRKSLSTEKNLFSELAEEANAPASKDSASDDSDEPDAAGS